MKKNTWLVFLTISLAVLSCLGNNLTVLAQTADELLKLNRQTKFVLKNKQEKVLILSLKKDDFTAIEWTDKLERSPDFSIIAPSGIDIAKEIGSDNPTMFIAKETGSYKLIVRFDDAENDSGGGEVWLSYTDVFKLPRTAKLQRQRKVNGYDIEVYNTSPDDATSFLLIKKAGKLKEILEGGSLVGGGFNFSDAPSNYDGRDGKKSALLMKSTVDKTGDGTPDIAVGFYTGGAHCCFNLHFYELGRDFVKKLKVIDGEDSDVVAIGKQPTGGLILKTGDSSFAYWLTSFAGSPIPQVILTYRDGEFRPDPKLMKKAPPPLAILKQKAAKAKKEMDLEPYTGEENSHFLNAFWGEMLDLLYSGNETAAWQYFDLVWDARKQGKSKFKDDFLNKLNESEYWNQIKSGKN